MAVRGHSQGWAGSVPIGWEGPMAKSGLVQLYRGNLAWMGLARHSGVHGHSRFRTSSLAM